MSPRDLILQQVLDLPVADQVFIAEALEDHLQTVAPFSEEGDVLSDPEFLAEIQRRSEEYHRDPSKARDWDEVMAELWARQAAEKRR